MRMLTRCVRRHAFHQNVRPMTWKSNLHWSPPRRNIAQKYLEKVQKRAGDQGIFVDELKQRVKEAVKPTPLPEALKLKEKIHKLEATKRIDGEAVKASERKDTSPVKALSEIMDIHKILRTPHTAEQISTLWTAFHASRSGGTGRGYLSASAHVQTYERLVQMGRKYPTFILPLMRASSQSKSSDDDPGRSEENSAYEFFIMQWSFHPAPPIPSPSILDAPLPENALPAPRLPISTVLFAPLLEYKTHNTFATPHLVLTMYPDLAQTHELVLLRGELTPSASGNGRYLLSQQDAQMLAVGLQRFYLAKGSGDSENVGQRGRAELLRVFNERPEEFRWEDLLKHANPTS